MQSSERVTSVHETPTEFFDLNDYCRLCLEIPEECQLLDLQVIYDEEEQLTYYDCFTVCTQIDLRAGGVNAPHQLCKSCGLELQVAYDFHKKVEESKRFLMQFNESFLDGAVIPASKQSKTASTTAEELAGEIKNIPFLIPSHLPKEESEANEKEMVESQEDISGHIEASIDYEELEDNTDMVEYQSVDELVDEDAETVQIKIDDEEYVIQKINISTNYKTDANPVQRSQHVSGTKVYESNNKTNPSCVDLIVNVETDNIETFEYESTDSEREMTNNGQNVENYEETDSKKKNTLNADVEIGGKSVVISKKGDVKPRRRYSGKFNCDYCQKVFKNRSRMLTHRRSHEPDRPKFECEECGRLYSTKQAKEVHVRTYHNRVGLKCPICGKIYVIRKLLEVHMRYHTGDFPYVCDLCGQKFAQMCHLNTHKNVKHNSVRYSCEHPGCGKFFTSSASLRNHEFSHSTMPFECSYCKRGYPAKAKLKVHIRQKHGVEASLEQMEEMRKFHVIRSKLNLVKISE